MAKRIERMVVKPTLVEGCTLLRALGSGQRIGCPDQLHDPEGGIFRSRSQHRPHRLPLRLRLHQAMPFGADTRAASVCS